MTREKQQMLLLAVLGALGTLVVADQLGVIPGRAGDDAQTVDETPSARSIYLARAALAGRQEALIAHADQWKFAAADAQRRWEVVRDRMILERTMELAEARFRDRALDALKDLSLAAVRVTPIRDRAPETSVRTTGVDVRPMAMEVKFDAASQRDVYAAIDRLESMGGVATSISVLRIDGPARVQLPRIITVTITLQAQAAVGEEAAAHG